MVPVAGSTLGAAVVLLAGWAFSSPPVSCSPSPAPSSLTLLVSGAPLDSLPKAGSVLDTSPAAMEARKGTADNHLVLNEKIKQPHELDLPHITHESPPHC